MSDQPQTSEEAWANAALAAACFAVDPPRIGGVLVRSWPGPQRDRWLELVRELMPEAAVIRRVPCTITTGRLLGGLDLAATLASKRVIADRGCLADAEGGAVVLAMAERLPAETAAQIAAVVDAGEVVLEREGLALRMPASFGVIALDEGMDAEEQTPVILRERLGIHLDLSAVASDAGGSIYGRADIESARVIAGDVEVGDDAVEAICETAVALGIDSLRIPVLALQTARAIAALDGRKSADHDDVVTACRLVLAPRAMRLPPEQDGDQNEAPPPPDNAEGETSEPEQEQSAGNAMADVVLEAVKASIPADLLQRLQIAEVARKGRSATGRSGAIAKSAVRGRPLSARRGHPGRGQRLDLIATLRSAAPWQKLRRDLRADSSASRVEVRPDDFHVIRRKHRTASTAIFAIDASGSSALHRLAEAKGAVELLLADCYVRRDEVAVLAFRGKDAELLLAPTRSLVRAKRSLAGLPGGGGTPLAAAIDAAGQLADAVRRKGRTPAIVLLTDGRANISRDGTQGRPAAEADAKAASRVLRSQGFTTLLIDTSPRPQETARQLAAEMNARYLALPHADAGVLTQAVQGALHAGQRRRE